MIPGEDLAIIAQEAKRGIVAMADGRPIVAIVIVGSLQPPHFDLASALFQLDANLADPGLRNVLERTLDTIEKRQLPPAGSA